MADCFDAGVRIGDQVVQDMTTVLIALDIGRAATCAPV